MFSRLAVFGFVFTAWLAADEGIWLFDHFPKEQVKTKYGVTVSDEFLRRLQQTSARFSNGGSGSFVSGNGLLFTNHHVGADCIQKLSSEGHDYMADGFQAPAQADEKACPDLEVNVLLSASDVTAKVNAGIAADAPSADANRARKANIANIEKACAGAGGHRCDVTPLYSGGQYELHEYKKYTDVRLVFAPEYAIAAFGGDPDNFTFPRYDLDFSLFRIYEDGKPLNTPVYLPWSHAPVKEGELTFVPGNPANTGRLQTVAQLEFSRDVSYPLVLETGKRNIDALLAFGARNAENKRVAQDYLDTAQNSQKAVTGFEAGLRDPKLMAGKKRDEQRLRAAIADDPAKQKRFGEVWNEVAAAYAAYAEFYKWNFLWEVEPNQIESLHRARLLARYPHEKQKPGGERLRGYQDAALPSLEQQMYSPAPVNDAVEELMLAEYFRSLEKYLGTEDPAVKRILNGETPEQAAHRYISTSALTDVAARKRLAGSVQAVEESKDGMIRLALLVDGPARKYRKEFEDKVEAVIASSASKIAQARFAVYGANEYPDATFTLRLSYGVVKSYTDAAGRRVPYATTFAGLYKRATGVEPYALPANWVSAKARLNLDTPFNFVTTADTHGGNSGSPTVNTRGEVVGILFDGNQEGLANRYVYTEERARSVHVAGDAIIEALRKVYRADRILSELGFEVSGPGPTASK